MIGTSMTLAVFVLVFDPDSNKFLFLKRHSDHTFPNQLCLPGGKVDLLEHQDSTPFCEPLDHAAHRELIEETGFCAQVLIDAGVSFSDGKHVVHLFVAKQGDLKLLNELKFPTREHQFMKWLTLQEAEEDHDIKGMTLKAVKFFLSNL